MMTSAMAPAAADDACSQPTAAAAAAAPDEPLPVVVASVVAAVVSDEDTERTPARDPTRDPARDPTRDPARDPARAVCIAPPCLAGDDRRQFITWISRYTDKALGVLPCAVYSAAVHKHEEIAMGACMESMLDHYASARAPGESAPSTPFDAHDGITMWGRIRRMHRCNRIQRRANACEVAEGVSFIGAIYLIARLDVETNGAVVLTHRNASQLFAVASLIAAKFLEDDVFDNKSWADATCCNLATLNRLELVFLNLIKWNVAIPGTDQFTRCWEHVTECFRIYALRVADEQRVWGNSPSGA